MIELMTLEVFNAETGSGRIPVGFWTFYPDDVLRGFTKTSAGSGPFFLFPAGDGED